MKNDLDLYKAHVAYWTNKISCNDWVKFFKTKHIATSAEVARNYADMGATFRLNSGKRELGIPYCAMHEVMELLVGETFYYLERFYSEEFLTPIRHRLIHRIESMCTLPTDEEVLREK